jgi:hypothetical protein
MRGGGWSDEARRVTSRTQLSLFVPRESGARIEAVRRVVDPHQFRLIPAHVTLCRDDEIAARGLADITRRLEDEELPALTLRFGAPERFDGHGILLPCIEGAEAFAAMRESVLSPLAARHQAAHLTLAHPRNPKVSENELSRAATLDTGIAITFATVQLIEQTDGAPWVVRRTFRLGTPA